MKSSHPVTLHSWLLLCTTRRNQRTIARLVAVQQSDEGSIHVVLGILDVATQWGNLEHLNEVLGKRVVACEIGRTKGLDKKCQMRVRWGEVR